MLRPLTFAVLASAVACGSPAATPKAVAVSSIQVGAAAPEFSLQGADGNTYSLAEQRGKVVVLEWYNPDCPFVKHAHGEGGVLRGAGDAAAKDGVVWWAVNSGAAGKQGHGAERNRASMAEYAFGYPVLLDEDGSVGRAYGAKTTPHMFVIGADGTLLYQGAVDNAPMGDAGGKEPVNYVEKALADIAAGTPISAASTKPYGCSVKY